jgi:hypothetical protein
MPSVDKCLMTIVRRCERNATESDPEIARWVAMRRDAESAGPLPPCKCWCCPPYWLDEWLTTHGHLVEARVEARAKATAEAKGKGKGKDSFVDKGGFGKDGKDGQGKGDFVDKGKGYFGGLGKGKGDVGDKGKDSSCFIDKHEDNSGFVDRGIKRKPDFDNGSSSSSRPPPPWRLQRSEPQPQPRVEPQPQPRVEPQPQPRVEPQPPPPPQPQPQSEPQPQTLAPAPPLPQLLPVLNQRDVGTLIASVYQQVNPEADVPRLLEKYSGLEFELYHRICAKYSLIPLQFRFVADAWTDL